MPEFASDFYAIPAALAENEDLRERVLGLVQRAPMPGKVLEGDDRLARFRAILTDLVQGKIGLAEAYWRTEEELPRETSPYSYDSRVFALGWPERLVRVQFSRFYNQAVLERLREQGVATCFVPHTESEDPGSPCTQQLAGREHPIAILYRRLIDAYARGEWADLPKIPDHPHCTHVIKPIETYVAAEFVTTVQDGVIRLPAAYRDRFRGRVRVIVLSEGS